MATQPPAKFSLSLGVKKAQGPQKNGPLSLGKRPRAALHDDDDNDDAGRHEELSHFDQAAGGAISVNKSTSTGGPLVIPVARKRRQTTAVSPQTQQYGPRTGPEVVVSPDAASQMTFGLNVPQRAPRETASRPADEPVVKKTEDEQALEALLTGKAAAGAETIIPAISEEEALHRDIEDAPDVPSLDDYAAVPIEQFGAALLRGMGWKDGEAIGRNRSAQPAKPKASERRPALLGVGAKPAAALGIELGAWGKTDKGAKKDEKTYNPVVLKNKVTGETITEEELKLKLAQQANDDLLLEQQGGRDDEKLARRGDDRDRSYRSDRKGRERDRSTGRNDEHRRYRSRSVEGGRRARAGRDEGKGNDDKDRHHSNRSEHRRDERDPDRKRRDLDDRDYEKRHTSRRDRSSSREHMKRSSKRDRVDRDRDTYREKTRDADRRDDRDERRHRERDFRGDRRDRH